MPPNISMVTTHSTICMLRSVKTSINKELKANKNDNKIIEDIYQKCHIKNKLDLKNILKKDSSTKRICFGCYGSWKDKGGLNRVVANISNNLSDCYDIIILSGDGPDGGYELNKKIKFLTLSVNEISASELNKELYRLLYLLGCDLYINLYNCELRYICNTNYIANIGNDNGVR